MKRLVVNDFCGLHVVYTLAGSLMSMLCNIHAKVKIK